MKFPMKFDECLRRVIGGRLKADRYRAFRASWRNGLAKKAAQHPEFGPSPDNVDEVFEMYKREGVDAWDYGLIEGTFRAWREECAKKQRSNAAKARWKLDKAKRKAK